MQTKLTMILAAVILLLLGVTGCEHQLASKYKAEAKVANEKVKGLLTTVDSKDHVIATILAANNLLLKSSKDQQAAMTAAAAVEEVLKKQIDDTRKALHDKEVADQAIPDCQKLLQMDLNVCPAHLASIRQRAK